MEEENINQTLVEENIVPQTEKEKIIFQGEQLTTEPEIKSRFSPTAKSNVTINGQTYYMDGYLRAALDRRKKLITRDWDFLIIVDGIERSGKSLLAMQMGYYLDPTLTLDHICFTPEEFKKACINAQKGQCIIFDEAFRGLSSRRAMSDVNVTLNTVFTEIGQKNLFIIVVLPSFFELDKYPAIHRSNFLVHVYADDDYERGHFVVWDRDGKKQLYLLGKKTYDYKVAKSNFYGKFLNYYPLNESEYREKKANSLKLLTNEKIPTKHETKLMHHKYLLVRYILECGLNKQDISKIIREKEGHISDYMYEHRDFEKIFF